MDRGFDLSVAQNRMMIKYISNSSTPSSGMKVVSLYQGSNSEVLEFGRVVYQVNRRTEEKEEDGGRTNFCKKQRQQPFSVGGLAVDRLRDSTRYIHVPK